MVFDLAAFENADEAAHRYRVTVVGKRTDPKCMQIAAAVEWIAQAFPDRMAANVELYFEAQFEERLRELRQHYGGAVKQARPSAPLVIADSSSGVHMYFKTSTDFFYWVSMRFRYEDTTNMAMYKRRANKANIRAMLGSGRHYCSLGFSINRQPVETVSLELFTDIVPKTVQNFLELLSGDGATPAPLLGSLIHRVVPGGWIQGGDCSPGSKGGTSRTLSGGTLLDENLGILMDAPGLLCMANSGPDTNGSQFFITVKPLPYFSSKYICFGRVVAGMRVVRRVNAQPIDPGTERPLHPVRLEEIVKDLTQAGDERLRAEVLEEQAIGNEDAEMNQAASKVQSLYRGRNARKQYGSALQKPDEGASPKHVDAPEKKHLKKKMGRKTAAALPVSKVPESSAPPAHSEPSEDVAATRLQSAYRGAQTRKGMKSAKGMATT